MTAAKKSANRDARVTLRHAWLAVLGAVAVARREAKTAAEIAVEEGGVKLGGRIEVFAEDARLIARGGALTLREKAAPALAKLRADAQARMASWMQGADGSRAAGQTSSSRPRKTARKTTGRNGAARKTAERARARSQR